MSSQYSSWNSNNPTSNPNGNSNWNASEQDNDSDEENDFDEGRDLASGSEEPQLYWLFSNILRADFSVHPSCAVRTGIQAGTAQPASREHFNQYPIRSCYHSHHNFIMSANGCSVHRGVRDRWGRCYWCQLETAHGVFYPARAIRDCYGYPGDDQM
jgi:hypothetical protein